MPKVSIIVPIYNVEKYLDRCIQSLLNQTLNDIEIILVDDESPDNCPQKCDEYAQKDRRIKVIHKKNEGLGYARNSGIEIAKGQFVAFVDSDDYVDLQMFNILYNKAKEFTLDTVFCGFNIIKNNQRTISIQEVNEFKIFDTPYQVKNVLLDMIGSEPSYSVDRKYQMSVWHSIYSRDIIVKNRIHFYSEKDYISEDLIFHIDYLQNAKKIGFTNETLYYYCANETSLTKTFRANRFEKYISLYYEICSKCTYLDIRNRAKRLFIGYTRTLFFLIPDYPISYSEKLNYIKSICNNSIWNDILKNYQYSKLPFYQILILLLIKYRLYKLLLFLGFFRKIINSNKIINAK